MTPKPKGDNSWILQRNNLTRTTKPFKNSDADADYNNHDSFAFRSKFGTVNDRY